MNARRSRTNLIGLILCAVVVVFAPIGGLVITSYFLRQAFRASEAVDPSEKAKLLASGISEAMNATACGIALSVFAAIPLIVFAVRLYRESKRA